MRFLTCTLGGRAILVTLAVVLLSGLAVFPADAKQKKKQKKQDQQAFTEEFRLEECRFSSRGKNTYFILEPGWQLVFQGREDGQRVDLTITVLNQTKVVNGVETRIVEERHSEEDQLVELSRNYFAVCEQTNSAIYFGEDVDMIEDGKVVSHDGAWLAGVSGARAGLMMPGLPLLGARYFQEVAPNVALDRAEIISLTEEARTPAGRFDRCLKVRETSPLEPKVEDIKVHCPGIGLVSDGPLQLSKYGRAP